MGKRGALVIRDLRCRRFRLSPQPEEIWPASVSEYKSEYVDGVVYARRGWVAKRHNLRARQHNHSIGVPLRDLLPRISSD